MRKLKLEIFQNFQHEDKSKSSIVESIFVWILHNLHL